MREDNILAAPLLRKENNKVLVWFLIISLFFAIGQLFRELDSYLIFQLVTVMLLLLILYLTLFIFDVNQIFILLFLIASSRYITGFADRELKDIIIIPLFILTLFNKKIISNRGKLPFLFVLYFFIGLFVFFNGLTIPNYFTLKPDQITGFQGRWWIISSLVCFIIGYLFTNDLTEEYLLRPFYIFYLTALIIGLIMFFGGINEMPLFNTFSWMKLETINRFGILSVAGETIILLLLAYEDKLIKSQLARVLIYLISFIGLFAGGGRSSFISLIIILFAFLFFIKKKKKLVLGLVFGILILVQIINNTELKQVVPTEFQRVFQFGDPGLLFSALNSNINPNKLGDFAYSEASGSTISRIIVWTIALDKIFQHPLLGNGIENQEGGVGYKEEGTTNADLISAGNLHNTFISLAYTWGIPAMIIFFVLFLSGINKSYKLYEMTDNLLYLFLFLFLISQLVESFMGDVYISYPFMILLGFTYNKFRKYSGTQIAEKI